MARWTGTWLSGLSAAGVDRHADGRWPGGRAGCRQRSRVGGDDRLPGGGAVRRPAGRALIGALVNSYLGDPASLQRTLVTNGAFALQVILLQSLTGQSIGMRLVGIRVARLDSRTLPPASCRWPSARH
jgi:hypothetical protein